jgi:long-chain fatty acid transport protein
MRLNRVAGFFFSGIISSQLAFAGGFQVNLQGQKQTGMGHTGTGLISDASAVFFNPGGMTFLDSSIDVVAGGHFIIHRTQYLEANPGTYTSEMNHDIGTPFEFYLSDRFKKHPRLSAGLGVYTPFGSKASWPDDWKGQFIIREIDLKTIFIQPTLSYQICKSLGVGAGFIFGTGDFALRKGVPVQDLAGAYGEGTLNGKAKGTGFNTGIYFTPTAKWSFGFSYRSQVSVKVDNGDAEFVVPGYLGQYFPTTTFSAVLKLPQVFNLGIGYKVNDKLRLAVDINRVGWSSYDSLRIDFTANTEKLEDISSARMYKDVFIYRIGAEYKVCSKAFARAGFYFDQTPVQDGYVTPETPDADRIAFTLGGSWMPSRHVSIDVSLLYNETKERTSTNLETLFSGTFKTKVVAPGIGFEYKF